LFDECVCIHYFDCSLVSTFTNKTQVSFTHTRMLLIWCCWEIHPHLGGIALKKSKLKPFSAFCAHQWAFSEPILHKIYDSLA
jgi:hypothetical protein